MKKAILCLFSLTVIGCGPQPGPATRNQTAEDPKLTALKAAIAKTTPQGKAILEKVQEMKPEVNSQPSAKSLGEVVEDFSKNKAQYNIIPIGWESTQKAVRPGEKEGRWKILFHYQDYQKQYLTAEWEYNPETEKLYPFDPKNAKEFWSSVAAEKGSETEKPKE